MVVFLSIILCPIVILLMIGIILRLLLLPFSLLAGIIETVSDIAVIANIIKPTMKKQSHKPFPVHQVESTPNIEKIIMKYV